MKFALDAQACAGPVGRAVEGAVNLTSTVDALDAQHFTAYGTSEGLFAGAGAHATWIAVRDAQNEEYYRREMVGSDILEAFGPIVGEMGRRHEEIFRLHAALDAASRGVVAAGGIVGGADDEADASGMGLRSIPGIELGRPDGTLGARRGAFAQEGNAESRGTPF